MFSVLVAKNARIIEGLSGKRSMPVNDRRSVYERLKQAILDNDLQPGQQLVETALAKKFAVSRTPIREALTRLEQDGLAEPRRRGLFVRERRPQEILDIYEVRCALEAKAGQFAAQRRTDFDLQVLYQAVASAGTVDLSKDGAMMENNREFHRALWAATHNETLQDLLERLDLHLVRYPQTTLAYPGRWAEARREHAKVVEAVAARDAETAHELMAQHFQEALDIRLKLVIGAVEGVESGSA